jgi:hypothetical protein
VEVLGGSLTQSEQSEAPSRIGVEVDEPDDLRLVAEDCGIPFVQAPSAHILQWCETPLAIASLRPLTGTPGGVPLSKYDLASGRWRSVPMVGSDGLYRTERHPRRLSAVCGGRPFEVEGSVGKYLAAAAAGRQVVAYDAATSDLSVPLGARLPGLYERAAVLCTGAAPQETTDGRVVYPGVTPEVAALIWARLGPGGIEGDRR